MSQIKLAPNASGTGIFTLESPNSNTNRTLTLPDATGTFNTSGAVNEVPAGSVSAPSIFFTGDSNTGIYSPTADTIAFTEGGTEAMRIDSSGNVLIGTTSAPALSGVAIGTTTTGKSLTMVSSSNGNNGLIRFIDSNGANAMEFAAGTTSLSIYGYGSRDMLFWTNGTERARITSGGYFKASNSGSYISTTSTYHECYQTADSVTLYVTGYNNSYTNAVVATQVQRSANAAYSFFDGYSGLSDLEFRLYGDGNGKCDGAWTGGGADYAEFFESTNGQALTLGATVVLEGNKVREATDQDPASAIIGVVRPKEPSRASAMIGNSAWSKWSKKYLTDDFDRYIMEDHDVVEWE